jgi:WD40 repeat protein
MLRLRGHSRSIRALSYAPDDPLLLASGGDDRTVKLWDLRTGEIQASLAGHRDAVEVLTFAHRPIPSEGTNALLLASGGRDGSLALFDFSTQRQGPTLSLRDGAIVALGLTRDREGILAARRSASYRDESDRVIVWRPGHRYESIYPAWEGSLENAAFAPNAGAMAIADLSRTVTVRMGASTLPESQMRFPSRIRCLGFAPLNQRRLLAIATGRMVELWDVEGQRTLVTYLGHRSEVLTLAFSADAGTLLTGSADRTVRRWDTWTGKQQEAWHWEIGRINAVALSPDGMTAAAGGEKSEIVIWDMDW